MRSENGEYAVHAACACIQIRMLAPYRAMFPFFIQSKSSGISVLAASIQGKCDRRHTGTPLTPGLLHPQAGMKVEEPVFHFATGLNSL